MKYYFPIGEFGMTLETTFELTPDEQQDVATALIKAASPHLIAKWLEIKGKEKDDGKG